MLTNCETVKVVIFSLQQQTLNSSLLLGVKLTECLTAKNKKSEPSLCCATASVHQKVLSSESTGRSQDGERKSCARIRHRAARFLRALIGT